MFHAQYFSLLKVWNVAQVNTSTYVSNVSFQYETLRYNASSASLKLWDIEINKFSYSGDHGTVSPECRIVDIGIR